MRRKVAVVVMLVLAVSAAPALAGPPSTWAIVASPTIDVTNNNEFWDVSCASSSSCMAVGQARSSGVKHALAEQWDGRSWKVSSAASTADENNELYAVSCVPGRTKIVFCMAVGYHGSHALAESWTPAGGWSLGAPVDVPDEETVLAAVQCQSTTSCMAVGYSYNSGTGLDDTLIESWDGNAWSKLDSPNPADRDNYVNDVSCPTTSFCVAVGQSYDSTTHPYAVSWDGSSWTEMDVTALDTTTNGLAYSVSCPTVSWCMAVGHTRTAPSNTAAAIWNGTAWSPVASVDPGSGSRTFLGVSCTASTSCRAVGFYTGDAGPQPLVESWDGSSWVLRSAANPAGSIDWLRGVSCTAGRPLCSAVGFSRPGSDQTLAMHGS